MRAKFIFEKFKEESDPISDMGIGYPAKQLNTKAWKILKFIESKGEEGAGLTEIQHYIWTVLDGHSEDSFWRKYPVIKYDRFGGYHTTKERGTRGMYATNLYGHGGYFGSGHPGLLHKYCKKNDKGKWVLVRLPKPREAFYK